MKPFDKSSLESMISGYYSRMIDTIGVMHHLRNMLHDEYQAARGVNESAQYFFDSNYTVMKITYRSGRKLLVRLRTVVHRMELETEQTWEEEHVPPVAAQQQSFLYPIDEVELDKPPVVHAIPEDDPWPTRAETLLRRCWYHIHIIQPFIEHCMEFMRTGNWERDENWLEFYSIINDSAAMLVQESECLCQTYDCYYKHILEDETMTVDQMRPRVNVPALERAVEIDLERDSQQMRDNHVPMPPYPVY